MELDRIERIARELGEVKKDQFNWGLFLWVFQLLTIVVVIWRT
jgi:hypothetical protein